LKKYAVKNVSLKARFNEHVVQPMFNPQELYRSLLPSPTFLIVKFRFCLPLCIQWIVKLNEDSRNYSLAFK